MSLVLFAWSNFLMLMWTCYLHLYLTLSELTPMRHENGLKTSLPPFFCVENAKNFGRSEDAKRRKKGDGLIHKFVTDIIGCSRVCAESNLVNAFRELLNASLEREIARLGLLTGKVSSSKQC